MTVAFKMYDVVYFISPNISIRIIVIICLWYDVNYLWQIIARQYNGIAKCVRNTNCSAVHADVLMGVIWNKTKFFYTLLYSTVILKLKQHVKKCYFVTILECS